MNGGNLVSKTKTQPRHRESKQSCCYRCMHAPPGFVSSNTLDLGLTVNLEMEDRVAVSVC
jgi:hypothetical protein